jgi:hypothetical protein
MGNDKCCICFCLKNSSIRGKLQRTQNQALRAKKKQESPPLFASRWLSLVFKNSMSIFY